MIKLIATDMDGTLLDDNKQLPCNFDDVVSRLFEKKIKFVISSGRSFCTLKEQFSKYLADMTFICDNGAYVVDKGNVLSVSVLPKETVKEAVRFCESLGLTVLLCGRNGTWHNSRNDVQHKEIASYYVNQVRMDDLTLVDDDIFKIAVFEEGGIENDGYVKLEERFGDDFNVQLSGVYWTDIMNKGVTKGTALKTIENRIGIRYEETMAFGDYLNDVDMLNNSYYSFAMSNAHESIKKVANFTTGSNNENSVMKEIEKHCLS
ncbi:HAD family hydrolase [Ruminococcus sp.]|uniref:HAD family hydrolase n=1 Tax=Ruminococcus sp. TaxID=41978 RepID=UPI0025E156B1|nr:HAD family hydrolase [Ruminococcus sp.]